jgi:hypothetical protein
VLRLGDGASVGDVKDTDLERAAGGVNAWHSTIDDETTTATIETFIANGRGFVIMVLAAWNLAAD